MLTTCLFASLYENESKIGKMAHSGTWSWTMKQEILGGAVPGIDPRPGEDPDPEPEPEPDPDPLPLPVRNPGPDPGFPIDPYPRPLPVRVTAIFQCKLH